MSDIGFSSHLSCGLSPTFLLFNKLLIQQIHSLSFYERGLYYILPSSAKLIHKVEIVGLVRKVYEHPDKGFILLTVDDGSGCIQCFLSAQLVQDTAPLPVTNYEELSSSLRSLCLSLNQSEVRIGHMVRLRGIVSRTANDPDVKRLKVVEYGIENDCNAFADWIFEVARVSERVLSVCNEGSGIGSVASDPTDKESQVPYPSLWKTVESHFLKSANQDEVLEAAVVEHIPVTSTGPEQSFGELINTVSKWRHFISFALDLGAAFTDTQGRVRVTLTQTRLKDDVRRAAEAVGEERRLIRNVCRNYKSGVITKVVVKYILSYLEQESIIYSYEGERGQLQYKSI